MGHPAPSTAPAASASPTAATPNNYGTWTRRSPPEHRYTRIFEGQRELIDHILISHALLTSMQSVDTQPNQVASITTEPAARRDAPASDQAPVVAQFT
jgi:exonuclease III